MVLLRTEEYCNGPVCSVLRSVYKFRNSEVWMDLGVSRRMLWIAEYSDVPLSFMPKRSDSRLNNGEIREFTAHSGGKNPGKYEFLHLDLPEEQIVVQEFRKNEAGETEITLLNSGETVYVQLPEIGKVKMPAHSLRTFRWE